MGLDAKKHLFGDLRTAKAQTSLRIRSAPLFLAFWKVSHMYINLLQAKFNFLASLLSEFFCL